MKRILTVLAVLMMMAGDVWGQTPDREGYLDLRIGGVFADQNSPEAGTNHLSVGVGFGGYFGDGPISKLVSLNFAFDYQPLSKDDFYVPQFGDMVRVREHGFLLSPTIGFDLVQTDTANITVSTGITASGYRQTFSLRNRGDRWENVCHLNAFRNDCSSQWDLLANYGLGARLFFTEDIYLGAVYTKYSNKRNQLLATLGAVF